MTSLSRQPGRVSPGIPPRDATDRMMVLDRFRLATIEPRCVLRLHESFVVVPDPATDGDLVTGRLDESAELTVRDLCLTDRERVFDGYPDLRALPPGQVDFARPQRRAHHEFPARHDDHRRADFAVLYFRTLLRRVSGQTGRDES